MKAKMNQLMLVLLITLAVMMFGYTLYAQNGSNLLPEINNTLQQEKR